MFACPFLLFAEPSEGLGIAAGVGVSTAATSAAPTPPIPAISSVPVSAVFTESVSAVPSVPVSILPTTPIVTAPGELSFSLFLSSFLPRGFVSSFFFIKVSHFMPYAFLMGPLPMVPSQFEVDSSFVTIPDPTNEAVAFFARFDQPKVNDPGPADFWGSGPPYADFHGFRVPEDCVSHLVMIHSNRGDFMQGFHLARFAREHFLRMWGSMMTDIEQNFVDIVSTERIL